MTTFNNDNNSPINEVERSVEVIEEVIAPGVTFNHNETAEIDLIVEELEEVITPGVMFNHNQTIAGES
ncbi:MAG: hypothetical protein ACRD82_17955, partial [Blastocatellia bacterium]